MKYSEALASAIRLATIAEQATVVKFWKFSNDYHECFLSSAVLVEAWDESTIVACVDHKGNVTEGEWIKQQRVKGLAA